MSVRSITRNAWTRIFVDSNEDFETAEVVLANQLRGDGEVREVRLPLRIVVPTGQAAQVYALTVAVRAGQLVTIEPGEGVPLLQDVETRLQWAEGDSGSLYDAWYMVVQAGLQSAADTLAQVEVDMREVRKPMARAATEAAKSSLGVTDLPQVSETLVGIDHVLSEVAASVGSLTQFGRLLRRESMSPECEIGRPQIDALVQQGEAVARRVEFLVDRHRFLSQGASQQISTSDLNIVKIFTVLWAILIPGTTLINWYGQNFEFMPELTWPYSSWVQIAGVFLLAVIPIYTVKRAGQLR